MAKYKFVFTPKEAASAGVSAPKDLPLLIDNALPLARTPISKFNVGVVGRSSSGRVFLGVNVEFPIGLPLHHTIHAEQFLVTNLALNSEPDLTHLAVSSGRSIFGAPCGHCRQFLQEISNASEIKILIRKSNDQDEGGLFMSLDSLMPERFRPDSILPEGSPLLLEHRHNCLTLLSPDSDLKCKALAAANKSFAPYSMCPSGVALKDHDGELYGGWYIESVAYNPSLGPVQAALVDFVARSEGKEFNKIIGAVLVETKDAVVSQQRTARILLQTISPGAISRSSIAAPESPMNNVSMISE